MAFVLELNADLEMGNHAAAGALAFLLSAVPALFLSFGLASLFLQDNPHTSREFQSWIAQFLGPVSLPDATPKIFGQGFFALGTLATVVGLLSASRMFFATIRKTLKVVWGAPEVTPTWVDTVVGTAVELAALVVLVSVLAASETARTLVYANQDELTPQVFDLMVVLVGLVPFVVLWSFFTITLRLFPLRKPGRRQTALYSLVAVSIFSILVQILRAAINTDQYEMLYGIIANLVVVLLNVSAFFTLYFMTAMFLFVEQHFDAFLFGRYYRCWGRPAAFPDNLLFQNPKRLKSLFSRTYEAGELLFRAGDEGRTVYFVEEGEVEIVLEGTLLDTLGPGQLFGETAAILGEPRNATARARTPLRVLELPTEVFSFYLRSDRLASKRIIGALADRLKRANALRAP